MLVRSPPGQSKIGTALGVSERAEHEYDLSSAGNKSVGSDMTRACCVIGGFEAWTWFCFSSFGDLRGLGALVTFGEMGKKKFRL